MILAVAPVLGCDRTRPAPGPPPVYTNTAFLSNTGNDSTAQLNDSTLPFQTLSASINALCTAYPGAPTTLGFKGAYEVVDEPDPGQLDAVLAAALTLQGYGGGRVEIGGTFPFGSSSGATLNLVSVKVENLQKTPVTSGPNSQNAGSILGNNAIINFLGLNGSSFFDDGSPGANGNDDPASAGENGMDGGPPDDGGPGGSANSSGGTGGPGTDGNAGWSVLLTGKLTVNNVSSGGGNGGNGGQGGNGGTAFGGTGGNGGNAIEDGNQDEFNGGNGGSSGDATSNGGDGGSGGSGSNGGDVLYGPEVILNGVALGSGGAGSGGSGGSAGIAIPGSGGSGGNGVFGGFIGNSGANGNAFTASGNPGAPGPSGNDGSLIPLS